MHEPVENRRRHGIITEVFAPVLHYSIRSDEDAPSELVTFVNN